MCWWLNVLVWGVVQWHNFLTGSKQTWYIACTLEYVNMHDVLMTVRLWVVFGLGLICLMEVFVERTNSVQWYLIYSEHTDWYNDFITNVRYHYAQSFPLVKASRKIMKDKPWVSKGMKISIKQNHRLYRASLISNYASAVVKYKRYNNVFRRCIKEAEMAYYDRLFQDTKTSSYNIWKH